MSNLLEGIKDPSQFSAYSAIQQYPNMFVHFSKILKLGVNPKKHHSDPYGIYFYYNNWLLQEDIDWSRQYAVDSPYYFICDIKKTKNSINLSRLDMKTAIEIATRNNWIADMQYLWNKRDILRKGPMATEALRLNGGKFYAIMDHLQANGVKKWSELLKGVDVVFDPGKSIINVNEPAQVIVLNPRNIQIIETGKNFQKPRNIFADVVKRVANKVNGTFFWKKGKPGFRAITKNNSPYTLIYGEHSTNHHSVRDGNGVPELSYFKNGILISKLALSPSFLYDFYSNDLEKQLLACVEEAEKEAEPTGRNTKWTREAIGSFMDSFYTTKIVVAPDPVLTGDGIAYWIRPQFDNILATDIHFYVKEDDSIDVNIKCSLIFQYKTLDSFVKLYSFSKEDQPQYMAHRILEELTNWIYDSKYIHVDGPDRIEKLRKLSKINLR